MGQLLKLILEIFEKWLERRRLAKLRRLRAQGRCIVCGYDLRMTTGNCPECGTRRDLPIS